MTSFVGSTYSRGKITASVACDDGKTASLYFNRDSGNAGIVGLPSHVAQATADAFNAAMAQPAPAVDAAE